jgi:hypothetical protein
MFQIHKLLYTNEFFFYTQIKKADLHKLPWSANDIGIKNDVKRNTISVDSML